MTDSGKPGWAIFSNEASLPKGEASAFLLVSGIRLVQAVSVHDVGGLQLNPGAEFGGELYRHELDSLGDYLRTLGMMNLEARRDEVIH